METMPNIKHQVEEEKKNREHLLQLNQILAQEVMEKSKIVASEYSQLRIACCIFVFIILLQWDLFYVLYMFS